MENNGQKVLAANATIEHFSISPVSTVSKNAARVIFSQKMLGKKLLPFGLLVLHIGLVAAQKWGNLPFNYLVSNWSVYL